MMAKKRKMPRTGASKTIKQIGQLPLPGFLDEPDWTPPSPTEWPDLRGSYIIGVDTETSDHNLTTKGPGFIRGDAELIGVSLANDDGVSLYLPLRHVDTENCDEKQVARYLKEQLGGEEPKCGANLQYDAESLDSIGVELKGKWCDVQVAEPLINEERKDGYSLEVLSQSYVGDGKTEDLLKEAAWAYSADPKKDMKWIPAKFVAEYAEDDAVLPIQIFMEQQRVIQREGLDRVFELEQKLQPVLWQMRKKGALLDMERVHKAKAWYEKRLKTKYEELYGIIRHDINYWASSKVGQLMVDQGYKGVPETKYGPSVGNEWLEAREGDILCETLLDLRISRKMMSDFIDTFIEAEVNSRLHPNWLQLATDEGGTKSGRMASKRVNLQQIPGRNKVHTPIIRGCFIAEPGTKFIHTDFSGQEARISVQVSAQITVGSDGRFDPKGRRLTGSEDMVQKFIDEPKTDFHNMVKSIISDLTGITLERGPLKNLNFGILYGMGDPRLAESLFMSLQEAKDLKQVYFKGAPFLKEAIFALQELANSRGFIRTASGRKRRFNKFQPKSYEAKKAWGWNYTFNDEEEVKRELGTDYERAFIHKVFNAVIQGSAADQTKHALVDLYYDHGIVPCMAVHDELNDYGNEAEAAIIQDVMENTMARAYGWRVPFVAKPKLLNNWGEGKD